MIEFNSHHSFSETQ